MVMYSSTKMQGFESKYFTAIGLMLVVIVEFVLMFFGKYLL